MNYIDYRELVKRYNPPKKSGLSFSYAVYRYAKLLEFNQLTVSQTIVQLYKDKRLGLIGADLPRPSRDFFQRHSERSEVPEVFNEPDLTIPWVIAGVVALIAIAKVAMGV